MARIKVWLPQPVEHCPHTGLPVSSFPGTRVTAARIEVTARLNSRLKFPVYWQNKALSAWITEKCYLRMSQDERIGGRFHPGTHLITSDPYKAVKFLLAFVPYSKDRQTIIEKILWFAPFRTLPTLRRLIEEDNEKWKR